MGEYSCRISVFGSKNVGKKTFAKSKFFYNPSDLDYMNTIGVEISSKTVEIHETKARLVFIIFNHDQRFWDKTQKINLEIHIRGFSGAVIMYDITNPTTLDRVPQWIRIIKNNAGDIPILLVGNKLDLEEHREVSQEQVEGFKENHDISSSMEISLKTGENVEKMFLNIACMILKIEKKKGTLEKMLEEKREYFIGIIETTIKTKKEKFEGKRKLKKQQKSWRKHYFGETESFEEYLDKQKENVRDLAEYKNEILNAKELFEMLKAWEKAKKLLNPHI